MKTLVLLILFSPIAVQSQSYHHYPHKNEDGKYGLLRRNLSTEITDTLVAHEYQDIWKADGYFVLIEGDFTEYKDGEAWGTYYKGRVIDEYLTELRKFDTIKKLPHLSGAGRSTFKFKEGGKEGFFSGAFQGAPWTGMYDEIEITRRGRLGGLSSTIEVPGYKWKRCGIIARNGDTKTLIGPLGDTIVHCAQEDSISIWFSRYFEVFYKDKAAVDLYTAQGELVESEVTGRENAYGPGSTIFVLSHLDGTQSLWTGFGPRTPPIPFELNINTLDGDKFIIGNNEKGEYYKLTWKGEVIAGPFEGYLKLLDSPNEAIKESGKWRLIGTDVQAYQDVVFDSLATLSKGRGLRNYAFYTENETVLISVGAKSNGGRYGHFWSAKVSGNTIDLVDGVLIAKNNELWARLTSDGMSEFIFDKFEALPNGYGFIKARIMGKAVLVNDLGEIYFENLNLKDIEAHNCEVGPMYELTGKEAVGYFIDGMKADKVELIYDDLECGNYGYCVKKGKKWGLIDFKGQMMLDFKYKLKKVREYEPDYED